MRYRVMAVFYLFGVGIMTYLGTAALLHQQGGWALLDFFLAAGNGVFAYGYGMLEPQQQRKRFEDQCVQVHLAKVQAAQPYRLAERREPTPEERAALEDWQRRLDARAATPYQCETCGVWFAATDQYKGRRAVT